MIFVLLISLGALILIQFLSSPLGFPPLPSRLIYFVGAFDCIAISLLVWQTAHKRIKQATAREVWSKTGESSSSKDLAKTLGIYAIGEVCACGIISVIFGIPPKMMWLPYLLFLIPPLLGLPLIFQAKQFYAHPKACAFRTALGISIFVALLMLATFYSGLLNWIFPGATSIRELLYVIVFMVAVVAVSTYHSVQKRLNSAS